MRLAGVSCSVGRREGDAALARGCRCRDRARADGPHDRDGRGRSEWSGSSGGIRWRSHAPPRRWPRQAVSAIERPTARCRGGAGAPLGGAQAASAHAARDHHDQPRSDRGRLGRRRRRHAERHDRLLELRRLLRARPLAQVPARRARRGREGRVRAVHRARRRGRSLAARAPAGDRMGHRRRSVPTERGAGRPSARPRCPAPEAVAGAGSASGSIGSGGWRRRHPGGPRTGRRSLLGQYVAVDDLVEVTTVVALAICDWCGTA